MDAYFKFSVEIWIGVSDGDIATTTLSVVASIRCMKPVNVARFLVVLVLALCAVAARAQQSEKGDYVVRRVSFEDTTGLTAKQISALKNTVLRRVFPRNDPGVLSEAVYAQLRDWGFRTAMVEDPDHGNSVRVLDDSIHPSPVAVVIYFRLNVTAESDATRN